MWSCKKYFSRFRYHSGYYRLTRRFLKLNLPVLSSAEKQEIRNTWPGVHIYDMDFFHARIFKKIHGFSAYYLSPCWYNEMREHFNPKDQLYALENKAMCDVYFPELPFPEPYIRRLNGNYFDKNMTPLTEFQAIETLKNVGLFVIKPAIGTEQGEGVRRIKVDSETDFEQLFSEEGNNFIAQAIVEQAEYISRLNPTSLNCFRVTTMYFNGRFGYATALKVGKKGAFKDNWNSSYWINVTPDGRLSKYGYDYEVNPVDRSDNGIAFENLEMPRYKEMISFLEDKHKKLFPNCCVIGWDVTLDRNHEILIIETNLWDPGTNIEQFVSGDFFKPFRDDMIAYLK